ncbi:hypothetical protein [Streptomyces sp. NBC_00448]
MTYARVGRPFAARGQARAKRVVGHLERPRAEIGRWEARARATACDPRP